MMEMAEEQKAASATPLQVAKAVFWSFFGIRRRAEYEKDAVALKPAQVIVAGIIGAILLVLSLVTLVQFIIR
jgi:preprotein translocase subunit Sec61beta